MIDGETMTNDHDVPDRAPDGQARREPTRCPNCKRSPETHLTMAEAMGQYGYARTDCLECTVSQTRRPK